MTRMLVDYLCGFHAVAGQLSASEDVAAQDALVTLLSAGLSNAEPIQDEPKSLLGQALRARALAYIDHHLSDPALGPDLLMQRFRVSRAHLYRIFSDLGGVTHTIKTRRLDAAYARIVDARNSTRPVNQAAADVGFRDLRRFRKAFMLRFGVTPEDAREWSSVVLPTAGGNDVLSRHFAAHSPTLRAA